MRAANRSLVLVIAFLLSAVTVPANATDDSPGPLESLTKTVDAVTRPLAAPAPAVTTPPAPPAAGPVSELTGLVDSTLGGRTSLSNTPVVKAVDELLTAAAVRPTAPQTPVGGTDAPRPVDLGSKTGEPSAVAKPAVVSGVADRALASGRFESVLTLELLATTGESVPALIETGEALGADVRSTSVLPDGGSPLTLAWLVLAFGATAAGALVIRRSRTA